MTKCDKCGAKVNGEDLYLVNGNWVCEDCSLSYLNPSQPCGGGHN